MGQKSNRFLQEGSSLVPVKDDANDSEDFPDDLFSDNGGINTVMKKSVQQNETGAKSHRSGIAPQSSRQ